jgi:hypothetical protein
MNSTSGPRVFISYGREDTEAARRLSRQLAAYGADVWLDRESLLPGSDWKREIRSAIKQCRYFVALLSTSSVSRRGFVNAEISSALEVLKEFPKDQIFVIPVRLDECKPTHDELSGLNWLDLFPNWDESLHRLLQVLGLAETEQKWSILDVSICGRCGSSNIKPIVYRVSYAKAYCMICTDCGWQWIGPDHLSDEEVESLHARYGDIQFRRKETEK